MRSAGLLFPAALLSAGCARRTARRVRGTVRLATTTSTENSGLLDALLPPFTEEYGLQVHVIPVGTGKAIEYGRRGEVDVILVHAREAEERFVAEGFGVNRRDVMDNEFVVLGPASDPAGIRGGRDAAAAFRLIARTESPFVSRGDESGTHVKEEQLWRASGVTPSERWYLSAGQGMGAVLMMAHERQAYALSDRASYLAYRDRIELDVLVEGDVGLFNPYGVIAVSPAEHPHVRYVEAMMLIGWITSPEGRRIIAGYAVGGERPFHPVAGGSDVDP